jgi:hypothetical protein
MGPRQGFASALSGCRIRRRETDCRRMGWMAVEAPLGGMVGVREDGGWDGSEEGARRQEGGGAQASDRVVLRGRGWT